MNKKFTNTVIFDLDGTLIDSSPGILESFEGAFSALNIEIKRPLNSSIIGPPLYESLKLLSGLSDKSVLDKLAEHFKLYYDSEGYKKTIIYPGILNMLSDIRFLNKFNIYIATNKRIFPTRKILSFLYLDSLFDETYALDSFSPHLVSKGKLIAKILDVKNISNKKVIYIGDREDDELAAKENKILFEMVSWGFDKKNEDKSKNNQVLSPHDLLKRIASI
jgi:phosphoglycolate phosphatase